MDVERRNQPGTRRGKGVKKNIKGKEKVGEIVTMVPTESFKGQTTESIVIVDQENMDMNVREDMHIVSSEGVQE